MGSQRTLNGLEPENNSVGTCILRHVINFFFLGGGEMLTFLEDFVVEIGMKDGQQNIKIVHLMQ